jgi:hypothetical protein
LPSAAAIDERTSCLSGGRGIENERPEESDGTFALRACIVNFRTAQADVEAVPGIVLRHGDAADRALRPTRLPSVPRD